MTAGRRPHPAPGGESRPERQPFVAHPGDVRRFGHIRRASVAEVAPSGLLRLDSIARWTQDVAWADVEDAGLRHLTLWLVRRTRILVHRFPHLDEDYDLTTFVSGVGRMWAERRTDIVTRGATDPDVEVVCIWVHIDPERLMPSAVHAAELEMWTSASTREVRARLRHPAPAPGAAPTPWMLRASEMDIAGHVNNAAYLTPIDDELLSAEDEPLRRRLDIEVEYRSPVQAGPVSMLAEGSYRWMVAAASGEVHASYLLGE